VPSYPQVVVDKICHLDRRVTLQNVFPVSNPLWLSIQSSPICCVCRDSRITGALVLLFGWLRSVLDIFVMSHGVTFVMIVSRSVKD